MAGARAVRIRLGFGATLFAFFWGFALLWGATVGAARAHAAASPDLPPGAGQAAVRPTPSGLAVPRFASLKVERVNVRQGPSNQDPVAWVYIRKGWPVEIIAEQDVWRRIRDQDGQVGWVHTKLLDGARMAVLQGTSMQAIRVKPEPNGRPLAWAEPGVLVKLRHCDLSWCEVQGTNVDGFLERTALWGLLPNETIE
jgi:SH3-like domain-containing protein